MQIKGQIAESILVEKKIEIDRELYVGITIDRTAGCPVVMVSSEGGVAIEETAAKTPEKVVSIHVDIFEGLYGYKTRKLSKAVKRSS
jgi:succinyl-CoA synthetase beta subunit